MPRNAPLYSIGSLPQAAAIMSLGYEIKGADYTNPKRVIFYFSGKNIPEIVARFDIGKLRVDARTLFHCFEELRTAVRNRAQAPMPGVGP